MRLQGRTWRALAAAGVVLVAFAALMFRLNDVPPGVQHDQVFNIVDAIDLLYGHYRIYFTANFGREPLFIYSAAALFKLANGHFIWGLRLASVVWATLGTAVSISLARRKLPPAAALVAVVLMVGSFWFLFTGRVGLRAISALTLGAATVYWLDRALTQRGPARGSLSAFLLSGLLGGLTIYTYLSARALLALAPALIVYEGVEWLARGARRGRPRIHESETNERMAARERKSPSATRSFVHSFGLRSFVGGRSPVPGLLLCWLTTLAVSAPLLLWLQAHPGAERRVGELAGPLGQAAKGQLLPLLHTIGDGLATLLWREPDWLPYQYNLPGRAALPPILAVLFVVGVALGLARVFSSRRERLWLTALALGIGPALITPGGPMYLRAIIALPLIYVYVAAGLWGAGRFVQRVSRGVLGGRTRSSSTAWTAVAGVVVAGMVVAHWAEAANAYFDRWSAALETQRIYNADLRAAADYSAQAPAGDPLYISTDFFLDLDQQTYLLYRPVRTDAGWYWGPHGLPLPPSGGKATYVWTLSAESNRDAALLPLYEKAQPALDLLRVATLDRSTVDAALESAGVSSLAAPLQYDDTLKLVAAGSVPWGDGIDLVTRWRVVQPWSRDMPPKVSARLVDATGQIRAQTDEPLALAYQGWQPGQEFVQVTHLAMPDDLRPADYEAVVAIYDERNGQVGVAVAGEWLATIPPAARVSVVAGESRTPRQPGEPPLTPSPAGP